LASGASMANKRMRLPAICKVSPSITVAAPEIVVATAG
jgi:hypothetical protein